MRVVELVAGPIAEPEPEAADVVPADGEDRAVRDGEDRLAELAEDVLAVVPAGARAWRRRRCRRTRRCRRPGRRSGPESARRSRRPAARGRSAARALRRRRPPRSGGPLPVRAARMAAERARPRARPRPPCAAAASPPASRSGGRGRRRRARAQRRRPSGRVDEADEDLAAGRQAAVRRGQHDPQADDGRACRLIVGGARRALGASRKHGHACPSRRGGTLAPGRRGDRLAERDHVRDGGAVGPAVPPLAPLPAAARSVTAVGGDLAVEERHRDDVGARLHARLGARPDRDARRVGPIRATSRRPDRRRARRRPSMVAGPPISADGRARLPGHDHLHAKAPPARGRRRRRGRDRRAGREAEHQQETEDREQCRVTGVPSFGRRVASPSADLPRARPDRDQMRIILS